MELNNPTFDDEELFHLALKAMENDQTDKAILLLKQLVDREPEHGRAHYLLGALHAEIGMYSRAIEDMRYAVELEPDLPTAHFQLGLLYATSGLADEAERTWEALDKLGESNPLFIFKRGLIHLIHDEFEQSIEDLKKGIQLNQANPALNKDAQRIIEMISHLPDMESNANATSMQENTQNKGGRHILLNAYQNNDYDKDIEH